MVQNKQNFELSKRIYIVILGIIQGLALYSLHYGWDHKFFTSANIYIWLPLYPLAILIPLTLEIMISNLKSKSLWMFLLSIIIVIYATTHYIGIIIENESARLICIACMQIILAWFITLPFIQTYSVTNNDSSIYKKLYHFSWQNFLLLFETAIFVLLVWLLLTLCASLFNIINIKFFSKLFATTWFRYIGTCLIAAIGIYLLQTHETIISNLRKHLLNIFKWLLPINVVILLLFIICLPVTGLKPLWDTTHASGIILALITSMIILLNATYQDGDNPSPFNKTMLRIIKCAIFTLPIYSAICIYSLGLRVDQYGWSVDRIWAGLFVAIATLYSIGYCYAAIIKENKWLAKLSSVNIIVSIIIILILILTNFPTFNPIYIAASSQISRLLKQTIPYESFDYYYFKYDLEKLGISRLQELTTLKDADHPNAKNIRERAEAVLKDSSPSWLYERKGKQTISKTDLQEKLHLVPEGIVEDSFVSFIQNSIYASSCMKEGCMVLAVDLNHDNILEYVLFSNYSKKIFKKNGESWKYAGYVESSHYIPFDKMTEFLKKGDFKLVPPEFDNIKIDNKVFKVVAEDQN